jgi:hypothetical protein
VNVAIDSWFSTRWPWLPAVAPVGCVVNADGEHVVVRADGTCTAWKRSGGSAGTGP